MPIVVNIVVLVLVVLIGYWWANQGLFSAIIHLLCVITAGALALAFWEPLTVGLLLRGGWFDSYAWGFGLLGVFVVTLLVLRLATNKLVPANVDIPRTWSLALGFPVGLASGVLTVGLLVIGLGFIQSRSSIAGFTGFGRERSGAVRQLDPMWVPVHELTAEFYGLLSVGSLSTPRPLRHYYPQLDRQAVSLARDTFQGGRGAIAMPPEAAVVQGAYLCPDACVLDVRFDRESRDYGQQLTLSVSQVRLVSAASGFEKPRTVHPVRWNQEVKDEGRKTFLFDDASHYITTVPGRESASVLIEFPWQEGLVPAFVQIKGARIDIPADRLVPAGSCDDIIRGRRDSGARATMVDFSASRLIASPTIRIITDIRPVRTSTNVLPGSMNHIDRQLSEGEALFPPSAGGSNYARNLQIDGIYEPSGTRVVQVDVSRGSPATIYGPVRDRAGDDAAPMLVDTQGNTYTAIGFIHEAPEGTRIKLDPGSGIRGREIPHIPTAGGQKLRLIFRVTEGSTITGFAFGDVPVVRCNEYVPAKR